LQRSCGGAAFNNLFLDGSGIDFAGHAASLGASSRKVAGLAELEAALPEIRGERRSSVIVIATDPAASTNAGGARWDVAVPAVSDRPEVATARAAYVAARTHRAVSGSFHAAPECRRRLQVRTRLVWGFSCQAVVFGFC